jgi:xylan 1,4-beta-xylosidase
MKKTILTLTCVVYIGISLFSQTDTIRIKVDINKTIGPMNPVWAWFGYDEPNYTYMKDGKKLLSEIASFSSVPVYVRCHNLLTSGDGTPALKWGSTNAYTEDEKGNSVYNWTIVDKIFDTYVERGMKPLVEIGFMPEALSIKPQPYKHTWEPGRPYKEIFTGWAYPPKDYSKWAELVYQWVNHSIDRYGKQEVETWYWQLWNEPNGGNGYWKGTVDEYCKLYDYTADAVKRALPSARIGGPNVTGPSGKGAAQFLKDFIIHCTRDTNYITGKIGSPLDFIGFHAKGAPRLVNGHVQMNMGQQLRDISRGFEIVASFPEIKHLPIIIGESDPEGCAACGMKTNPENAYRNGTMYSSYTAASFPKKMQLADYYGVNFTGAVTWAFEFEDQPWFYGFRDLATNGVGKPVLNVFQMFGMMKGNRVEVSGNMPYSYIMVRDSSVRKSMPDINALACNDKDTINVLVWNYHDNDLPAPPSNIMINIAGLKSNQYVLERYQIDSTNCNSYEAWKKMGSPQNPSSEQIEKLRKDGMLKMMENPNVLKTGNKQLNIVLSLPRQGVCFYKIYPARKN